MSIRIHHGLRALDSDPFVIGRRVRESLEPVFLNYFEDFYKQAMEAPEGTTWDELFLFAGSNKPIKRYSADSKLHSIIRRLHDSVRSSFCDLDIGYSVSLIENGAKENPLVFVSGERANEYRELLIADGVVESYGYWDDADRPNRMSATDWLKRKEAWSPVFDVSPSEVELSISFPASMQSCLHVRRSN